MEQLKKLHDEVKNHEYRLGMDRSDECRKSYKALLWEFLQTFTAQVRDTQWMDWWSVHDMYASLCYLGLRDELTNAYLPYIEAWIGVIHQYIETGTVYTYYEGTPSKGFCIREYNAETGKFEKIGDWMKG